jgi:hypothetical protein
MNKSAGVKDKDYEVTKRYNSGLAVEDDGRKILLRLFVVGKNNGIALSNKFKRWSTILVYVL